MARVIFFIVRRDLGGSSILNTMLRFVLIVTGYNCEGRVKACVDSIKNQTYKNFIAVVIDDGSTDNTTGAIINETLTDRFFSIFSKENEGAAKRRFDAIKKFSESDEDVIVLIGLDDEIKPTCLEVIKNHYDRGKWVTYGNWIDSNRKMLPKNFLNFDIATHKNRDYRKVKYRSTAPNTFKRFLFDQMIEEDFKFEGKWIKATTESNLMISCLEMSGFSNIGVIHSPIYLYNVGRSDSAKKRFGSEYQDAIYADVVKKPKRDLLCR